MGHENRRWATAGYDVTGTATDGRPDRTVHLPALPGETPEQRRALAERIVEIFNRDGEPVLTRSQRAVYNAVRTHEAQHDWPPIARRIAEDTGYTEQWVYQVFDQ